MSKQRRSYTEEFKREAVRLMEAGAEDLGTSAGRVVRGGSFIFGADLARAAFRNGINPNFRSNCYGFRLVCAPILSG